MHMEDLSPARWGRFPDRARVRELGHTRLCLNLTLIEGPVRSGREPQEHIHSPVLASWNLKIQGPSGAFSWAGGQVSPQG